MTLRTPSSSAATRRLRLVGRRPIAPDSVASRESRDGLQREPRADRVGSVPDQTSNRMRVARFVRLDEERALRAQARGNQSRVDERKCKNRRDDRARASRHSIRNAEKLRASRHCLLGDRPRACPGPDTSPLVLSEGGVELKRREQLEPRRIHENAGKGLHRRKRSVVRVARVAWAENRRQGHDGSFTQMIDRRIGDLRKPLAKVARQRTPASGQRRDRGVVPHRGDGIMR